MKIAYTSDLHLEHSLMGPLTNNDGADVLVLAGDIVVNDSVNARGSGKIHKWFADTAKNFDHVIYIMGNHEYYDSKFPAAFDELRAKFSYIENLHVLENEQIELDGKVFWCGTLWTDCTKSDPLAMYAIKYGMNDFAYIKLTKDSKFTPETMVEYHNMSLRKMNTSADVVVTHHCPSIKSVSPAYYNSKLTPAYYSDLENFILDSEIKHWICGHTHYNVEYDIGDTTVHSNCRGYPGERIHNNFKLKYVDV